MKLLPMLVFSKTTFLILFLVLPRYIRVNTLVASLPKVLASLKSSGYESVDQVSPDISQKCVSVDPDVEQLLVLPPNTDLHANSLVKDGSIILQDKVGNSKIS